MPDYFFTASASSSGKYHAAYALGIGGLYRHTIAAVTIANCLLSLEMYNKFTDDEKDIMLAALILHDGAKRGVPEQTHTITSHPLEMVKLLRDNPSVLNILTTEEQCLLIDCISSHMGQWNTDHGKEILPKPVTKYQKCVHLCDYLASRKFLEFNFGDRFCTAQGSTLEDKSSSNDDLQLLIKQVIEECKNKKSEGFVSDALYDIISKNNDGNRNPSAIKDINTAKIILNAIKNANKE